MLREMDGPTVARNLRPDGVLPVSFDGLRVPLALPRLAAGGEARAVRTGQAYVDVGTVNGYHDALRLLGAPMGGARVEQQEPA